MPKTPVDRPRTGSGSFREELLHLFALCSGAFAAPLFLVLGAQAEFFVARRSPSSDVIAFALLVTLLPPALLVLLEMLIGLINATARSWLHRVLVAALLGVILMAFTPLGLFSPLLGCAGAVAYHRYREMRDFCARMSVAGLLLPLIFVFFTPVRTLVLGGQYGNPVSVDSQTPVVLLVFDELPLSSMVGSDLTIDARTFPNFHRLQLDSLWFRNAVAAADDTMRAVPAILTGNRAPKDKPPVLHNYPRNLFTMLAGDYRLAVSENLTSLAPLGKSENVDVSTGQRWRVLAMDTAILYLHRILPPAYTGWLPPVDKGWVDFANELERPPREQGFLSFLSGMSANAGPTLYYYHANFPHYPYSFLPDGREYDAGSESGVDGLDSRWMWLSPWQALQAYQRHLLQAMFADRMLGLALDRLEELGLSDKVLMIVVADHGSSYRHGAPFRPAAPGSLPGVGPVPLLVKLPGAQHPTGVIDRPVTTMDVLPTIVEVLRIPTDWSFEGHSLLDATAASTSRQISADVMKTADLVPYPDDLGPLENAVEHKIKVFGPHLEKLYSVGPAEPRVGQPLTFAGKARLTGSLLWPGLLADVRSESRFVPNRLRGYLAYAGPSVPLVVGLNGRIAGSTLSLPAGTGSSFSALIDPALLKPGRNEVSLGVMKADGTFDQVELQTPPAYKLTTQGLAQEDGTPIAPEPRLEGQVVSMVLEEGGFKIDGWAAVKEGQTGRPADRIVVFQGDRYLLTAPPSADGTFRLSLPRPVLEGDAKPRVFALGAGGGRELEYLDSYRKRAKLH